MTDPQHDQADPQPASFGDVEQAGLKWGDMEAQTGADAQGERHVVGAVCICPVDPPQNAMNDPACPQHGRGPQTPEELARVAAVFARATEAGEIEPSGHFVAEGAVGSAGPPLPPLGEVGNTSIPGQEVTREQILDELADEDLQEAKPEDLVGSVTTLTQRLLSMAVTGAQRWSNGERCTVDVVLMPMPANDGSANLVLGVMIYHEIPGMILGKPIHNAIMQSSVSDLDQPWFDTQMRVLWEGAREQRRQQPEALFAQQRNAQAARAAMGNGHTPPGGGSGLIVPGR